MLDAAGVSHHDRRPRLRLPIAADIVTMIDLDADRVTLPVRVPRISVQVEAKSRLHHLHLGTTGRPKGVMISHRASSPSPMPGSMPTS